jgi:hypothetical protein
VGDTHGLASVVYELFTALEGKLTRNKHNIIVSTKLTVSIFSSLFMTVGVLVKFVGYTFDFGVLLAFKLALWLFFFRN